ncbi:MAG: DUF1800 family protein [Acidobacteriota bacterium]
MLAGNRRFAKLAAFSAVIPMLCPGAIHGATTFQAAYLSAGSGAASGGAAILIVGNQFQSGATVTVGGTFVGATVKSSTLISATMPSRPAGGLSDVVVTNPDSSSSTLPFAWLADFNDVSQSSPFHGPVEQMVRDQITSGCTGGNYCPDSPITRAQMAVFLLRAKHGGAYVPPPPSGTVFYDVHTGDFAADWIEQLYAEGVTGGCAPASPETGNLPLYCPNASVTRGQMAVFLLKIYHGVGYVPPPATGVFGDVDPGSNVFAAWIEELARLQVTVGCGNSNYCPEASVTRGQMAVFMTKTFHRPEASRLLEQASWGPTDADVSTVLGRGTLGWLADQYSATASSYALQTLWPEDIPDSCDDACRLTNYSIYPLQTRFFTSALYNSDQLRQRVSWGLHKIIVVSADTIPYASQMAPYLRILDQNAFGSYRDILYQVTLNPAMGAFLNTNTSTKYDPNENYAREILQLFSIGTELLNQDGTTQNDVDGKPLASYDQSVIDQFKRVYTGWYFPEITCPPPNGADVCNDYISPMTLDGDYHDTDEKDLFVGFLPNPTVLPAGQSGDQDLNGAIDAIFQHPNVGPYVARELIHSLVTSNPTPAYVERVAGFFNDSGASVRGNLWAVVKAILLDPEARTSPSDPVYGHLKEPVLYANNLLRAFHARSADGSGLSDGHLNPQTTDMGQGVFRPPTVFSYFPQAYVAPPASAGVLGPEFGIMNASTSLKRANWVNTMVFWGGIEANPDDNSPLGTSLDFSELQALAVNTDNLVDRLNRLLMHDTMSDALRGSIVDAVNAIDPADPYFRGQQALYLVVVASQYQTQR